MQFIRETGCVPRCTTPTYDFHHENTDSTEAPGERKVAIILSIPMPEFTTVEEYEAYG